MSLLDDLGLWEAGELSRDELLERIASSDKNLDRNFGTRSPVREQDVPSLLDLHERLTEIAAEPLVAYHESDWDRLRDDLPDRLPRLRSRMARSVGRPLVAASLVVGLGAAAAAASPVIRDHVASAWHSIEHVVGIHESTPSRAVVTLSPTEGSPRVGGSPAAGGNSGGNSGGGNSGGNGGGNSGGGNSGGGNSGGNSGGGTPGGENSSSGGGS